MLFDRPNPPTSSSSAKIRLLLSWIAIAFLISASTGTMMLCPCDSVGIHDHYAIFLVAVAALFAVAAALLLFRRMRGDSADSAFQKAITAFAVVALAVYAELLITQEVVAWMARPR
jgi:hypothetical protein